MGLCGSDLGVLGVVLKGSLRDTFPRNGLHWLHWGYVGLSGATQRRLTEGAFSTRVLRQGYYTGTDAWNNNSGTYEPWPFVGATRLYIRSLDPGSCSDSLHEANVGPGSCKAALRPSWYHSVPTWTLPCLKKCSRMLSCTYRVKQWLKTFKHRPKGQ